MDRAAGTISTIVGTGEPGFSGDGAAATAAQLNEPKGVAIDYAGNLYIADSENHVVRKVDRRTGIITTVAGQPPQPDHDAGQSGAGEGSPDLEDDPFSGPTDVMQRYTQTRDVTGTVRFVVGQAPKTGRFGGDGGPARGALLNFPAAVATDRQGHLYIADTLNHRVRKVDAETGVISTIAGTGQRRYSGDGGPAISATLNEPAALVCNQQDVLYIADQGNHRIRKVDLSTETITTIAGIGEPGYSGDGMPASESMLSGPSGLALAADGGLYIADTFNGRIRRVDPVTGVIATVTGDGNTYQYQADRREVSTSVSRPYGIAVYGQGDVLITDSDNHLLRRWDRDKKVIVRMTGNGVAGYGGDGQAASGASLNYPFGVAVDKDGVVYIADTFNHRIRMIAA